MLAHRAAVPSRYLRLWVLNFAAALLQLDIVAFANMPPGGSPGPGAAPSHGPVAADGRDRAAAHEGAGEDPRSAGSGGGPWQAEPDGSNGGGPGGLQRDVLRRQGLAMAVLDCLVATMQREARAETAPVDASPRNLDERTLGGDQASGSGVCLGKRVARAEAPAPGAAPQGDPKWRKAGRSGGLGGDRGCAGDWEAAAAAAQAAALGDWADDARWRLELLAQMAPSVQQRRPGRTAAWGSASFLCPGQSWIHHAGRQTPH